MRWQAGVGLRRSALETQAPSYASAWGYTAIKLDQTFPDLSMIDLNNTGNPGYLFYTRIKFPYGFGDATPTPSNNFSIVANGLHITQPNTNGDNVSLSSAVDDTRNGYYSNFLVDQFMGALVRIVYQVSGNTGDWSGGNHPSLWLWPIEGVASSVGQSPSVEDDILEIDGSAVFTHNIHQWTGASSIGTNLGSGLPLDGFLHTVERLIVPMWRNGGTGLRQIYYDGVHQTSVDVSYSATGAPSAPAGAPNGTFSQFDKQHAMIMLGGPITINRITVFGPP